MRGLHVIGRMLVHYRVEAKLAEGGMGVVYRAFDTHLDRPVAIKVLRPDALDDPERKRRFVKEAKAASALNHPNIITIYDISSAEGTDFIAMEYVRGKTLDQVIGRKGLELREALKTAVQAADALASAHAAGIVHRDIKPANIMVTDDGLVKMLDFGLAKLTGPAEADGHAITQSAVGGPRTEEGTILGTVAYMSPEQAQGKPLDARSDIFSFGSVLYEMLTGQRAFQRETSISTLSAILRDDPKPVSQISQTIPRDAEKIITRCLRKDPGRRFQHMADLKVALEELMEESESVELPAVATRWSASGRGARTHGCGSRVSPGWVSSGRWVRSSFNRRPRRRPARPGSSRLRAFRALSSNRPCRPMASRSRIHGTGRRAAISTSMFSTLRVARRSV